MKRNESNEAPFIAPLPRMQGHPHLSKYLIIAEALAHALFGFNIVPESIVHIKGLSIVRSI